LRYTQAKQSETIISKKKNKYENVDTTTLIMIEKARKGGERKEKGATEFEAAAEWPRSGSVSGACTART
jgi:hypothetical protein